MHNSDLLLIDRSSVLEGEAEHPLRRLLGDELDALHHTIHDNMLNARVFTLGVLTDQDGVDVVVGGLVASDRPARADVGEEIERATESKVKGNMALSNGGLDTFKRCPSPQTSVQLTARGPLRAT